MVIGARARSPSTGCCVVMVLAVVIPLALGLFPRLPLPGSVVEILAGILIGPAVLGLGRARTGRSRCWPSSASRSSSSSPASSSTSTRCAGRPLRFGLIAFALSVGLGLVVTIPLGLTDVILDPLLVTIILSATSLGIVMPVLKDAGQVVDPARHARDRGVLGRGVRRDRAALDVLLRRGRAAPAADRRASSSSSASRCWSSRSSRRAPGSGGACTTSIGRLQDTSAQIRIRIAVLALLALLVLSQELKFDAILGAFMAGALLSALTDPERDEELGGFRHKLEAIGFGFFIPVFFVVDGHRVPARRALRRPVRARSASRSSSSCSSLVRGLPALLLRTDGFSRRQIARRRAHAGDVAVVHRRRHRDRRDDRRAPPGERGVARRRRDALASSSSR